MDLSLLRSAYSVIAQAETIAAQDSIRGQPSAEVPGVVLGEQSLALLLSHDALPSALYCQFHNLAPRRDEHFVHIVAFRPALEANDLDIERLLGVHDLFHVWVSFAQFFQRALVFLFQAIFSFST